MPPPSTSAPATSATASGRGPPGASTPALAEAASLPAADETTAAQVAPVDQGDMLAAAQAAAASTPRRRGGSHRPGRRRCRRSASAAPPAVAYLAAAMVKQANSKTTSFDIELHPADLGRVDVKLQIQADGQLAARMSFDNPAAAANFQAHADDLRRSLEQAGFQLSKDSLSSTGRDAQTANGGSAGAAGQGGSGQSGSGQSQAGSRAFAGVQAAASMTEAAVAAPQNLQAVGLDVRI